MLTGRLPRPLLIHLACLEGARSYLWKRHSLPRRIRKGSDWETTPARTMLHSPLLTPCLEQGISFPFWLTREHTPCPPGEWGHGGSVCQRHPQWVGVCEHALHHLCQSVWDLRLRSGGTCPMWEGPVQTWAGA
jgi:hypothetical protein